MGSQIVQSLAEIVQESSKRKIIENQTLANYFKDNTVNEHNPLTNYMNVNFEEKQITTEPEVIKVDNIKETTKKTEVIKVDNVKETTNKQEVIKVDNVKETTNETEVIKVDNVKETTNNQSN